MSIDKKSLISNRVAAKKAIATKPNVSKVASTKLQYNSVKVSHNSIKVTPNSIKLTPSNVRVGPTSVRSIE